MGGRRILMGVVGRPHGVRGLLRVQSYTANPANLSAYAPLVDDKGRTWSLAWRADGVAELRDAAGRAIADRSAAERLTNLRLYVDRDQLPPPEDADEYYLADLIGLRAEASDGSVLGTVTHVHDYGAGTSLEVACEGQPAMILPFTRACVPVVDTAAGRVVVVPPAESVAAAEAAE